MKEPPLRFVYIGEVCSTKTHATATLAVLSLASLGKATQIEKKIQFEFFSPRFFRLAYLVLSAQSRAILSSYCR
jgi:hypothetical protein